MMTAINPQVLLSAGIQHRSKAGYIFSENEFIWLLDNNIKLNTRTARLELNEETEKGFVKALAFYACNYSSTHTSNILNYMSHMLKTTHESKIAKCVLINYKSILLKQNEHYLGTLKGFLKKWHQLGYPGVTDDVIALLNSWRLKGNEKGDLIKRLDPQKGPLTDIELLAFNEGIVQAFERNQISIAELAIGLCCSHTGRRSIQISHLKIKDVLKGHNKQGKPMYLLNVPRAKQRASFFREQFKQFAITKELWTILSAQALQVTKAIQVTLSFELKQHDKNELPLFADFKCLEGSISPSELRSLLKTDRLHCKTHYIQSVAKRIASVADIFSERTGEPLNITTNRFRYTTGTRAAREGFGEMVIAELLDHSDIQNAGVYIENIPEHVEALDKAVGQYLAPYAQAFAGVLVDREFDAVRGDDPTSRVRKGNNGLGTCGSHGFCGANVPVPCYTCIHYQPWMDGPHEIVLDELIAERERIKEVTGDIQIAAVNDRTILAVSDVIRRCDERKEQLKEELSNG
jgi:integrase